MPKYEVNQQAVAHARELIEARQYVIRSRWQEAQPSARIAAAPRRQTSLTGGR